MSTGVLIDVLCAFSVVWNITLMGKIIEEGGQGLEAGCLVLKIAKKAQIMLQRLTIGWYSA